MRFSLSTRHNPTMLCAINRSRILLRHLHSHFSPVRSPIRRLASSAKMTTTAPTGTKPVQLYSLGTPNGQKVAIALEEMGVEYDAHKIDISKNTQFQDWFTQINPNSKIPCVTVKQPDGSLLPIMESGAILIYFGEQTGKFLPKDVVGRTEAIQWVMFQMSGLGPMTGQFNHFWVYAPEQIPYAKERYLKEARRLFQVVEDRLKVTGDYLVKGQLTIADFAVFPWVRYSITLSKHKDQFAGFPLIEDYIKRLESRPATAKGLQVTPMA